MARKSFSVSLSDELIALINTTSESIHFSRSWVTEYLIKRGILDGGIEELEKYALPVRGEKHG